MDGLLVVFDTESVFTTFSATDVQCMSVDLSASLCWKYSLELESTRLVFQFTSKVLGRVYFKHSIMTDEQRAI